MKKYLLPIVATSAGALSLLFYTVAFNDVPRNHLITSPGNTLIFLSTVAGAVIFFVLRVWMKPTAAAFYCALAASLFLSFFSVACLCV